MTRTELIARHRFIADHDVNFEMREIARATADMLEADARLQAAARLAVEALHELNYSSTTDTAKRKYYAAIDALNKLGISV